MCVYSEVPRRVQIPQLVIAIAKCEMMRVLSIQTTMKNNSGKHLQ